MRLEYANLICPKCGNGNYMRHLVGENVGELNVKCINCNSYFKLSDFYRMAGKAEAYTMTNADRIRSMTDEELAEKIGGSIDCEVCKAMHHSENDECPSRPHQHCVDFWLDWLKAEWGE